jgi:hypothetical protein
LDENERLLASNQRMMARIAELEQKELESKHSQQWCH